MKRCLLVTIILYFNFNITTAQQEPTYAKLPDSSNVLVVYNSRNDTSTMIKDYYQLRRGIPEYNIVALDNLSNDDVYDPESNTTHRIILDQNGEIIRDSTNTSYIPYRHSWLYFINRVAAPIAEHLQTTIVNGDTLKNIIRFIVLCKKVPFRIMATVDCCVSCNQNVPVDGLLCFLGEDLNNPYNLMSFFNLTPPNGNCNGSYSIDNPYYNVDSYFSMDHIFIPNHYKLYNSHFGREIKLSYLISHLDGMNFNDVRNMIDSSIAAINSTGYDWFIDTDPSPCSGEQNILEQEKTKNIFDALGITNYFIDTTEEVYTSHSKPVMSYISNGRHTSIGTECKRYFQPDYLQTQLNFNFIAGAVFNTAESFNATTLGTDPPVRNNNQGQIPEFFHSTSLNNNGGTVAVGQVMHGPGSSIVSNSIMLPSYALGYSFIEAAYLGMKYLSMNNVVVGDPLTRLAFPCETIIILNDTTITSEEIDCDIIVPENVTLTIAEGSVVSFLRNAKILIYGTLILSNNSELNFNGYSELELLLGSTVVFSSGVKLIFNNYSKFINRNDFELTSIHDIEFYDNSVFDVNGMLNMNENSKLTLNNNAALNVYNNFSIKAGAELNLYNNSKLNVYGSFLSSGDSINSVTFNLSDTADLVTQIMVNDGSKLKIINTIFNNSGISYSTSSNAFYDSLLITNTTFNNSVKAIVLSLNYASFISTPEISYCTFNNCIGSAIDLKYVKDILIEKNNISLSDSLSKGIEIGRNHLISISNCTFNGNGVGIVSNYSIPYLYDNDLTISKCLFKTTTAIELSDEANSFNSVSIISNIFDSCNTAISINQSNFSTNITGNSFVGTTDGSSELGILIANGSESLIKDNYIKNYLSGIIISNVANPIIIENTIITDDLMVEPNSGILLVSSNGEIRANAIVNYNYGIELGSSSPFMGGNSITNSKQYGFFISTGSVPDLSETIIGEEKYPLSGYNIIRENGLCNNPSFSEIYLDNSFIDLENGCNTIADDREDGALQCNYLYLIDGDSVEGEINAIKNYWGEYNGTNPSGRFGPTIIIDYNSWLPEACDFSDEGSPLVLRKIDGNLYDTLYSNYNVETKLNDLELRYAIADKYYFTGKYREAYYEYVRITESYEIKHSLKAFILLYNNLRMLSTNQDQYLKLKDYYLAKSKNISNNYSVYLLTHLANLCLISSKEYSEAIKNYKSQIIQKQNTNKTLYRTIDLLTLALLIGHEVSLRNLLGEFNVENFSGYVRKIKLLINSRWKSYNDKSANELLPNQYALYQNFPNPFNPTTTIRFDLPESGNVKLILYDLLGRKIKTLISEKKHIGRYEILFNASDLASGVYIYQLRVNEFISSKKMLLIK